MVGRSVFGWTWTSYFFLCGGLSLVWFGLALSETTDPKIVIGALGMGAFVSGLISARMSPYPNYVPWVLAAGLGAVSVLLLLWYTPLGQIAEPLIKYDWIKSVQYGGGVVFLANVLGSMFGDFGFVKSNGTAMGWLLGATWLSMGTLFLSSVLVASLVVNTETEKVFQTAWNHSASLSDVLNHDRLVFASALSLVGMAFLSGVIVQTAAPRRMLTVSSLGAPIVIFMLLAWFSLNRGMFETLWRPALVVGGFAFAAAWIGATFVYLGQSKNAL